MKNIFGVSPAFVVAKYGDKFTVDQFSSALEDIKGLGFEAYQPEIFHREELNNWYIGGAKKVNSRAEELGLIPTQFVAHFLMESFSTKDKLFSDWGIDDLKKIIAVVKDFPTCKTIVIPIGKFNLDSNLFDNNTACYEQFKSRLYEKMKSFLSIIEKNAYRFAIEILPNSIIEGNDGFLDLYKRLDSDNFGLSLDTGHAWACRELVPLLPLKLKDKIFGLHLCDNDSDVNKSFAPGRGTIDWKLFMYNLRLSGYDGSLDLEIICDPDNIEEEYSFGMEFLNKQIDRG